MILEVRDVVFLRVCRHDIDETEANKEEQDTVS